MFVECYDSREKKKGVFMAKKRGNPVFGKNNPHAFSRKGENVFDAQLKARVESSLKDDVTALAEKQGVTVPDIIRTALKLYLEEQQDKITA